MIIKNNKGSISIYLALSLTLILSLLLSITESCRINVIKTTAVGTSYVALESTFGHFANQLFDKYGIFGTFKTEDDFIKLLNNYINQSNKSNKLSFSLENTNIKHLYRITDNDGLIFASQVVAYQKYNASKELLRDLLGDNIDIFQSNNITSYDFKNSNECIDNDQLSKISDANTSSNEDQPHISISSSDAKAIKESLSDKISFMMRESLIKTCLDNPEKVSNAVISEDIINVFPSNLCSLSENAKNAIKDGSTSLLTSFIDFSLYASYLKDYFSTFMTDYNNTLPIKYQLEYILFGGDTDEQILCNAIVSIISMRTSMNLVHILGDSSKRSLAHDIASAAVGSIPVPFIIEFTQLIIMSSWANAEAIIDMRDLFKGKKVPLLKDNSTWTLDLENVLTLSKSTSSCNPGDTGLTYNEYLYTYLLTTNDFYLYFRTMDLIQLDLCHNVNKDFLMTSCFVAADVEFEFNISPLFIHTSGLLPYTLKANLLYGYD